VVDSEAAALSEEDRGNLSYEEAAAYTLANKSESKPVSQSADGTAMPEENPLKKMQVYFVGLHPLKDQPDKQILTHFFCHRKTEHFCQCVLYDGNNADANMIGVKYTISREAFDRLPSEEKKLWHPQNFEILSGLLAAPAASAEDEREMMRGLMNGYGKVIYTWTPSVFDQEGDALPLGQPKQGWSFNKEGQAKKALIEQRDQKMKLDSAELRERRQELANEAESQFGEDALDSSFARNREEVIAEGTKPNEEASSAHAEPACDACDRQSDTNASSDSANAEGSQLDPTKPSGKDPARTQELSQQEQGQAQMQNLERIRKPSGSVEQGFGQTQQIQPVDRQESRAQQEFARQEEGAQEQQAGKEPKPLVEQKPIKPQQAQIKPQQAQIKPQQDQIKPQQAQIKPHENEQGIVRAQEESAQEESAQEEQSVQAQQQGLGRPRRAKHPNATVRRKSQPESGAPAGREQQRSAGGSHQQRGDHSRAAGARAG